MPLPSSSDNTAPSYTIMWTFLKSNVSLDIIKDLNLVLGPLVKVVDGKIYPLHRSLRNHLVRRSEGKLLEPTGHFTILSMCLGYLELVFNLGLDPGETESPLEVEFNLLNYAILYWPIHFQGTNSDPAAIRMVSQFMGNDKAIAAWSKLYLQQIETDVLDHETVDTPF
ncbi:hypothetical protein G7Y89_g15605 [Cudoniella acicularis]|uniref:Uncharacterized protein n=1 Tax=Cudoniella acicularis TaxID=354080 RepID=A0A8H4QLC4_9HELO|nr:hypothetical protein G7Y89_g15605 [Cudoniella acicularis]